ncbi:MAG: MlaD family protein [Thermodesulfovibrionia bacterium]|nr:MlaD family protein [Thermodesulfovibrionia bacterium]
MSKQANKTLIGSFVVGAVVLVIAGVLIFGSGRLFTKMEKHVLYFKGSVKGLNIGSPVMFRGVKIGSVTDILLQFNSEDLSMRIPVIIDIEPEKFISQDNVREMGKGYIDQLITKGLRAQLQMQSMVTGQLMINLDFYPDKPATLAGIKGEYPEIPTISSDLEALTEKLGSLPIEEMFSKMVKAIEGIEKIVNSPELIGSVGSFDQALKDIHSLLANIDKQFTPLANSVINTSIAAQSALGQFEKTIKMEEGAPADLAAEIKDTLATTRDAMEAVKSITAKDSESVYELNNALKELSAAARSIRFMADYIEQHPEALIRGKRDSEGE